MSWGKRIVEWLGDPAEALATELWLNDRFALDGRGATGYTNILWCFGKHDRPIGNRPVFGSVRTMTFKGMQRKFEVDRYIRRWGAAATEQTSGDGRSPTDRGPRTED